MSKFKEKVLSEISFAMVDDIPDLQKLYDKVAATDEHSELNVNQKIVLEWLKSIGKEMPIYRMADQMKWYIDYASTGKELSHALAALSKKEEFQVLAAFAEWGMKEVAE